MRKPLPGNVDHRETRVREHGGRGRSDRGDQTERPVPEVREGMGRVDRERGQDGQYRASEVLFEETPLSSLISLGPSRRMRSAANRGWTSSRKQRCWTCTSSCTRAATAVRVCGGVSPSGLGVWSPAICRFQHRHADHEELVQIRAEDGEELDAFEQGHGGIVGLFEHPPVELEPGQLTVHERFDP